MVQLEIGEVIRFYRKRKKITQQQLADHCGISKQYLSKIEGNEHIPNAALLLSVIKYLKIPLKAFF